MSGTAKPAMATCTSPRLVGSLPAESKLAATGSNGPRQAPLMRISSPGAIASCGVGAV
jgi:hypothetical protein